MAAKDVTSIEVDGITVEIDQAYVRSWPGLDAAARMQDESLTQTERFVATVRYYSGVCPNINDVLAALREARPDEEVTGSDVMEFVARAIRESTPKN